MPAPSNVGTTENRETPVINKHTMHPTHTLSRFLTFCALFLCAVTALAVNKQPADTTKLHLWQAGAAVNDADIEAFGKDRCFASENIPDNVWKRMQGKSYKDNPYVKRADLRYIRVLHHDYDGKTHLGELVCHRKIADKLVRIFRKLYDGGYKIQHILLPENYDADDETQMRANNSSCFNFRAVSGSKKLSKHARGLAIDLNPLYNPYCKERPNGTLFVQPSTAKEYTDRSKNFRYKIDKHDLAYRLFTEEGFSWGGNWRTAKDYQHFEWRKD